jgi:hypothetical protein
VFFLEVTGIWVALKDTEERDEMRTIDRVAYFFLIPSQQTVPDGDEIRCLMAWGMCIYITDVALIRDDVV